MDKKGRLFIPAKFRDEMGEKLYVCRSISGKPCLTVYSETEFNALSEKINRMPTAKKDVLQTFFFPSVADLTCDATGRVIIPAELRTYAKLEKNITIIGLSNKAEIWDEQLYAERQAKITPEDIAKLIEELDI